MADEGSAGDAEAGGDYIDSFLCKTAALWFTSLG